MNLECYGRLGPGALCYVRIGEKCSEMLEGDVVLAPERGLMQHVGGGCLLAVFSPKKCCVDLPMSYGGV